MSMICYQPKRFNKGSLQMIANANAIIEEYRAQGFVLTLRQLYYQFVSRDLLANKQTEYHRLGGVINDARMAGLVDWEAIEDRTRNVRHQPGWNGPEDILEAVAQQYKKRKTEDQPYHIEVWIEKDALTGVIEPICRELEVDYFACRGYSSQSEQWRAGQRFVRKFKDLDQRTVVLHLGDHDPSGIDMTRDNLDRLNVFVQRHASTEVIVERLALNMDQVEQYDPPPNPAKLSDSRATGYIELYGESSWELDALNPPVIAALIREAVGRYRDQRKWDRHVREEKKQRMALERLTQQWDDVLEFLDPK